MNYEGTIIKTYIPVYICTKTIIVITGTKILLKERFNISKMDLLQKLQNILIEYLNCVMNALI